MSASPSIVVSRAFREELGDVVAQIVRWPLPARLFGLFAGLLYAPVLWETAQIWLHDDQHAHGVFIFPLALGLLWILRHELQGIARSPSGWGVVLLIVGLLLESVGYLARVKFVPFASLILVLWGGILLLHGRELWRRLRFVVFFLIFAAPIPNALLMPLSANIQNASTVCAAESMSLVGYPLIRTGNRIDTPKVSVEVAEVCSGFKKLIALTAFACLYGFLFDIPNWKRALLVLSAYPIALIANSIRISALIAIGSEGGDAALHAAHDWAEIGVLVMAFVLFTLWGRLLGCKTLRFSL